MTISLRRALFALALSCSFPPTSPLWLAPAKAQVAPEKMTLTAVVRDAQGKPVEGADVVVLVSNEDAEIQQIAFKTDAKGRFETQRAKTKWATEAFVYASGFALHRAYLKAENDNEITLKPGTTATGKVVDADGKPVAGARVEITRIVLSADEVDDRWLRNLSLDAVRDSALKRALATQTDANGVWQLNDLPAGSTGTFELNDPRFARDIQFGLPNAALQTAPDLTAKPGATLKGRIVTPDGQPVARANITANVGEGRGSYASTKSAPDGTYVLTSLPAGDAKIQVSSPSPSLAPASVKGVTVVANKTTTAPEIRLDAGVLLQGKVLDKESKAPLEGARVNATGDFGSAPSEPTGKDGVYSVRVPTGQVRFYLYGTPTGYLRDMFADAKVNITAASTNAPDFAIARGLTLTGNALDETGAPAQGAFIIAGSSFDGAQTTVDADGTWTLNGVNAKPNGRSQPSGKVQLKTTGDWQIVGDGIVSARAGDEIKLTLRRIERQNVTLRVVTPEGEPVEGAQVKFAILFDATNGSTRYETAVSNARGEVTVRKPRPDESAEVTATKADYALQKAGVITTLQENEARATDAILTPKNGTLRGRIVDAAGVAVKGARVAVLWPGDVRQLGAIVESDADGRFGLDNLRAGELLIGAARGRDWGQTKAQTGGDVEIRLMPAAPQPAPEDRVLARTLLQRWFEDQGQRSNSNLAEYAARVASLDAASAANLAQGVGKENQRWFDAELARILGKSDPQRAIELARAAVDQPKKPDEYQSALLDLATLLVQSGDLKGAGEIYASVAPTITDGARVADPNKAISESYRYAQLAGIAGAIGHADADYWLELLERNLAKVSADDRMFRIGGYAKTMAENDITGALNWLETRAPAERVRAYEDVIPVVATRDLPRAQELLNQMEELVARGDLPIEPDRNDAMYRPKPTRSLNVARAAIVKALLPTDPRAAYEQAQKITADGYELERLQIATALRLPPAQTLPILREQFEEARKNNNRSASAMARLARLVAPLDAQLSEQWFDLAREKLAPKGDGEGDERFREMAAPYAFYRAASNPAQSRLLLENEWQRQRNNTAGDDYGKASRLQMISWAMVPVDLERALQMMGETSDKLGDKNYNGVINQRNFLMWILASERERREIDFERPSSDLFE